MNYVICFVLLLLIIVQIRINATNKKMILSQTGLPISAQLDIKKEFLAFEENYFICLSTECSICQKMIIDFCKKEKASAYLLFFENRETVINLINELNVNIDEDKIIYDYVEEKLYLSVTPFVYITNENGVIIEKKVINKIEEI